MILGVGIGNAVSPQALARVFGADGSASWEGVSIRSSQPTSLP